MPEIVSAHFDSGELWCPHCFVNGCHQTLVDALEAFRASAGLPVLVDSAYRCPTHNREVGGAPRSEHMLGLAADIRVKGLSAADLEKIARTIPAIKGIGRNDHLGFLHIDVREVEASWTYNLQGQQAPYYPA